MHLAVNVLAYTEQQPLSFIHLATTSSVHIVVLRHFFWFNF